MSNFNTYNIQYCRYCGKECHNLNSLKQHECRCKKNPNKISTVRAQFNKKGKTAWNKGLTKDDPRVKKGWETFIKNQQEGKHLKYGHMQSEATKAKLSVYAKEYNLGGFNMRRGIYYNGIKLDSSYEVILAENLDNNNIRWERCKRFSYHINEEEHQYTPDFYLPDYDIYLDPKNDYLINNPNPLLGCLDIEKIKLVELENNIRVLVLNKDQLTWDYIKTQL